MNKEFIFLLLLCSTVHCHSMEKFFDQLCTDGESILTQFTNDKLPRKSALERNLIGSGISFIASSCAVAYGFSNFSQKHSSKLGAFIALTTGILGMGYCGYFGLWKNFLLYQPYIPK